ncbi:TetR/AcrR family transcriptional regulator [Clostridium kluyveri]|uniref:TetR/AcrR family transcriptional regulator n=1 Tax=Clostridium kluyveri TaxID=1534 RepID=UPI002245903B|nr:TetR/AcrR family transcriptional regulator [Clostridium kluyveri]UZQ49483.1 TetR/AcrR family transcriptional regulator [Clostridium kluyveri]
MSSKKEDLLNKAEILFYEHSFHSIGLKRVINEANVAVMTLYNHFASKEDLIMEVLKRREKRYFSYLASGIAHTEKPVVELAKAHLQWLKEYSAKGCMFLRAKEEFGADPSNEIVQFVNQHKQRLLYKLCQYCLTESAALKLMILFEGATALAETEDMEKVGKQLIELSKLI